MKVRWHSRPTSGGQGAAYSFQPQWEGLDEVAQSWAMAQLAAAGWIPDDRFSFYSVRGEQGVETPDAMLWEADRILTEGFGVVSHELAVPAVLQASPGEKRRIKQTQPGRPLSGSLIVFHWQRSYALRNHHKAALEERDMTAAEIAQDGEELPRYWFTAYHAPEGTSAERQQLRELIASSGFEKRSGTADWIAVDHGDEPALRLKLALKAAGVDAVHYHEIPAPLIVPVTVDGQL